MVENNEKKCGVEYAVNIARAIHEAKNGWLYRDGYITFTSDGEKIRYKAIYPQFLIVKNALCIWSLQEKQQKEKSEKVNKYAQSKVKDG